LDSGNVDSIVRRAVLLARCDKAMAATRQPSDTPSVITRLDTAQRLRNVNAGAYSGDPYHA